MKKTAPGFTPLELILVFSAFLFLASLLFAFLSGAWRDARGEKDLSNGVFEPAGESR